MSETMNGAELARLILRRGTTAAQIVEMDVEALTETVAYRRKRKVAPGAIDPALTDEQLARAILEYAQSEPVDWPVPPLAERKLVPPLGLGVALGVLGFAVAISLVGLGVLAHVINANPYADLTIFKVMAGLGVLVMIASIWSVVRSIRERQASEAKPEPAPAETEAADAEG